MTIDFYYMLESPPCRTVLMVAKHLNIKLNLKPLDLSKGQHLGPDFIDLNPCHCLPTIVDNGFVLWESRAIITYLVNNYYPSHSLYPSDPRIRATIDKFLHFDLGTLYKSISTFVSPLFFGTQIEDRSETNLKETLDLFDSMIEMNKFVCGHNLSLADISIISGFTLLQSVDYQIKQWTNICQWILRVKNELKNDFEDIHSKAIENTRKYVEILKEKNKL